MRKAAVVLAISTPPDFVGAIRIATASAVKLAYVYRVWYIT